MTKNLDLTTGSISKKLFKLSLPIMGTSFMQCGYNMVDMFWVGKTGANAVAAVGTAGFYPWLAVALIIIARIGGEVRVAQSIGEKNEQKTRMYIKSAIELNIIHALIYSAILIIFSDYLIGFFRLHSYEVNQMGSIYLKIIGAGMIFTFMNPVFTAIFNGMGNSSTPFKINAMCLLINIVLDPILILGIGGFPKLGVTGAALATVFAQMVGTIIFMYLAYKQRNTYFKINLYRDIDTRYYKELYKLGFPPAIQSAMFTLISMTLGVIVAIWGPVAIAAQKVGTQIESISYMTADGMASAMSSFVGQNVGAKEGQRVKKGIRLGLYFAAIWGILSGLFMIVFGREISAIFINEKTAIAVGSAYLIILGYSQPFNCIEIIASGIFKGLGRTILPSFVSIFFNALRIPAAILLSRSELMGLNGVWWAISISSIVKGIIMFIAVVFRYRNKSLYPKNSKEEIIC